MVDIVHISRCISRYITLQCTLLHFLGKGENIWDKFAHDRGDSDGDNTCDGYYRTQEDISYLKKLGVSITFRRQTLCILQYSF